MRIALAANLVTEDTEAQAEYDSQETLDFILGNIRSLGHEAELLNLTRPLEEVLIDLKKINPELIFNIAEGNKGRFREAFWPAIFAELNIPFTGSDAYTLMLSLDKNLTKEVIKKEDVLMPQGVLVNPGQSLDFSNLKFPLILKPNFEGSSKGITQDSIAENLTELQNKLPDLLKKYPEGMLVEEYIEGLDITVPYLANLAEPVLNAIKYIMDEEISKTKRYRIYDYEWKSVYYNNVGVEIAKLSDKIKKQIKDATLKVIAAVGCQDLARLDFRLTPQGEIYFIEINCLPSLDSEVGFFVSAADSGITKDQVFNNVIQSAAKRYNLN